MSYMRYADASLRYSFVAKIVIVLALVFVLTPIPSKAQYSGPPAEGGCNTCETEAAGEDAPHLQTYSNNNVQETDDGSSSTSTRSALLQLIISLMAQLQALLEQLKDEPAVQPTPQPVPSPYPPHPDELGATCSNYTYDTCPNYCSKKCEYTNQCANPDSDFCGEPDCNGPGSCFYDPTPRSVEPVDPNAFPLGSGPWPNCEDCQ